MLQRVPRAQLFATGSEDCSESRYKLSCWIFWNNLSVQLQINGIKRHCQNGDHLRQQQRYLERYFTKAFGGKHARPLHEDRSSEEFKVYLDFEFPKMSQKDISLLWYWSKTVQVYEWRGSCFDRIAASNDIFEGRWAIVGEERNVDASWRYDWENSCELVIFRAKKILV